LIVVVLCCFYLVHFTSYPFFFPSPKHNSLFWCFVVQPKHRQLGRVTCDDLGTKYVFPCQLLIVVVLCCFYLVHFTSYPFFFPPPKHNSLFWCFVVQPRHRQLGRVTCDDLGTKYVFPCQLLIVLWSFVVFIWSIFTSDPFFFLLPNTTAFKGDFRKASAFNADISNWDVSSVTQMYQSKSFLANC